MSDSLFACAPQIVVVESMRRASALLQAGWRLIDSSRGVYVMEKS